MRSGLRPHAVMRVEGAFAYICAWCPDLVDANAWAEARGLTGSHGICKTCTPKLCTEVVFEAGERCAAPTSDLLEGTTARGTASVVPSCRLSSGGNRR
jgi:hypothetical protein